MKQEILDQLLKDKADKRPVVLATHLGSGEEKLFYPGDSGPFNFAGKDITPDVRAAVRADKAQTVETDPRATMFLNVFNPPLRHGDRRRGSYRLSAGRRSRGSRATT